MRRYKERSIEQLQEELRDASDSSWDGKNRCVEDTDDIKADGHVWAVINDHGNADLYHRGRNGHLYYHGGLV